MSMAIVAPSAAICASERSTKMTPALDHVHTEVGVDAGEDEARGERCSEELGDLPDRQLSHYRVAPVSLSAEASRFTS